MTRAFVVPIALFAGGLAIIVAMVLASGGERASLGDPADPRERTFATSLVVTDGFGVYVEDQPAGVERVTVGSAAMAASGFVVVFSDDDGVPGDAIGSSALVPQGRSENVFVPIRAPIESGAVYYAMLYRDDGNGTFDPARDRQQTDGEGNVVMMSFVGR